MDRIRLCDIPAGQWLSLAAVVVLPEMLGLLRGIVTGVLRGPKSR